jgi:ATP adenylyltransferase
VTQRLWAPWRLEYIQSADETSGCFLCDAASPDSDDEALLVVRRTVRAVVLMNRFPYSSGHLLVAPHRHGVDFGELEDDEALELHRLAAAAMVALGTAMNPQGFNVGWNLGRIAGAGVIDHAHLHVVPRWSGDVNFMPVLADVKVIPEHLVDTRRKVAEAWPSD